MCQSWEVGLGSLHCGKWRKISRYDNDLDDNAQCRTRLELFPYTTIYFKFQVN